MGGRRVVGLVVWGLAAVALLGLLDYVDDNVLHKREAGAELTAPTSLSSSTGGGRITSLEDRPTEPELRQAYRLDGAVATEAEAAATREAAGDEDGRVAPALTIKELVGIAPVKQLVPVSLPLAEVGTKLETAQQEQGQEADAMPVVETQLGWKEQKLKQHLDRLREAKAKAAGGSTDAPSRPTDQNVVQCPLWAKRGDCEGDSQWMCANCLVSCADACAHLQPRTPPPSAAVTPLAGTDGVDPDMIQEILAQANSDNVAISASSSTSSVSPGVGDRGGNGDSSDSSDSSEGGGGEKPAAGFFDKVAAAAAASSGTSTAPPASVLPPVSGRGIHDGRSMKGGGFYKLWPLMNHVPAAGHVPPPSFKAVDANQPPPLPRFPQAARRNTAFADAEANPADFGGCSEFSVSNAKVYAALSPDGSKAKGQVFVRCNEGFELKPGVNPERICLLSGGSTAAAANGAGTTRVETVDGRPAAFRASEQQPPRHQSVTATAASIGDGVTAAGAAAAAEAEWYPRDGDWAKSISGTKGRLAQGKDLCIKAEVARLAKTESFGLRRHLSCLADLKRQHPPTVPVDGKLQKHLENLKKTKQQASAVAAAAQQSSGLGVDPPQTAAAAAAVETGAEEEEEAAVKKDDENSSDSRSAALECLGCKDTGDEVVFDCTEEGRLFQLEEVSCSRR